MENKTAIVIGAGFAGLSAAINLADKGYKITLLEKNNQVGGRARIWSENGFTFDMGPSWYWMPDVFEDFFARFGKKVSDYYNLHRLDPGYEVYFPDNEIATVDASMEKLEEWMEKLEPGSFAKLEKFLVEAEYKYKVGINDLVYKPSRSLTEFIDLRLLKGLVRMDVFSSMRKHVNAYFKHPYLRQLMEFPILFLGAVPSNTPALYSLMNYADLKLGTWYPEGGMYSVVRAMEKLAIEYGVDIKVNSPVTGFTFNGNSISGVTVNGETLTADVVVAGADYHHVDKHLLPGKFSNYTEKYWKKRKMAPSSLLFYVGIDTQIKNMEHHTLYFDAPFDQHADAIYTNPRWPETPLYYVSNTSKTDTNAAPDGCEALTFLIPLAPDLVDSEEMREKYFHKIMDRFEATMHQEIRKHVVVKRSYAMTDFVEDYNAFKGNAYGLANTLDQTAILKPSLKNKHLKNLFYTGQLTVPGPGVPPSIISGIVVAEEISKEFGVFPQQKPKLSV
ncbi:MAG: phytoene desaturase [Cryomorphaceae bacterium]|nr:phytoene desaturase [Cryomorphaceae bacterium]